MRARSALSFGPRVPAQKNVKTPPIKIEKENENGVVHRENENEVKGRTNMQS